MRLGNLGILSLTKLLNLLKFLNLIISRERDNIIIVIVMGSFEFFWVLMSF